MCVWEGVFVIERVRAALLLENSAIVEGDGEERSPRICLFCLVICLTSFQQAFPSLSFHREQYVLYCTAVLRTTLFCWNNISSCVVFFSPLT